VWALVESILLFSDRVLSVVRDRVHCTMEVLALRFVAIMSPVSLRGFDDVSTSLAAT